MDRSITEADGSQGEVAREALRIMKTMGPNMHPEQKIAILRKIILCVDKLCPISALGVKKMEEHVKQRMGRGFFFRTDVVPDYNDYKDRRAILLVNDRCRDSQIGVTSMNTFGHRFKYTAVFLFLAENGTVLAVQSSSRMTDIVELADDVRVIEASDSFLVELMLLSSEVCSIGNVSLVSNALDQLTLSLHLAQDKAQKRANAISEGKNVLYLVNQCYQNCLAGL